MLMMLLLLCLFHRRVLVLVAVIIIVVVIAVRFCLFEFFFESKILLFLQDKRSCFRMGNSVTLNY